MAEQHQAVVFVGGPSDGARIVLHPDVLRRGVVRVPVRRPFDCAPIWEPTYEVVDYRLEKMPELSGVQYHVAVCADEPNPLRRLLENYRPPPRKSC